MLVDIAQQRLVSQLGFPVAAPEAQPRAERLRQAKRLTGVEVLLIQEQENAVIARRFRPSQALRGDAEPDLAEKDDGLGVGLVQFPDRRFHIGGAVDPQRVVHPHDPAGGEPDQGDGVQRRGFRVRQPVQAVVDLPLDPPQLPLLLEDRPLLLPELFLDPVDVPVLEEVLDLGEGHVQRPQVADGVQRLKLLRPIVAVAGVRGDVGRGQKTQGLIMPQAADADVEELRYLADGKEILSRHILSLLTRFRGLSGEGPRRR